MLAGTVAVYQDLVDLAGRAGIAVSGGSRPGGANLAGSVDSAETLEAGAGLGGCVVDLVGAASASADAPLVGEEAREAVAVPSGWVVGGVDGAGHAVAVVEEEVGRAGLAGSPEDAEAGVADTGLGGGGVGGVLAADEDALVG